MSSATGMILFVFGLAVSIALHEWGHLITAKWSGMRAERYFVGFGPTIWSFRRGETEYGAKWLPLGGFVRIAGMSTGDERQPPVAAMVFDPDRVAEDRRHTAKEQGRPVEDVPAVPERTFERLDRELKRRGVSAKDRHALIEVTVREAGSNPSRTEVAENFEAVANAMLDDTGRVSDARHRVLKGDEGRFFHDRPAWQRTLVLSAGSGMHFLLAVVLLFFGFWGFGAQLDRPLPVVEATQPGSPAEEAGLQPGDRLVAVDGDPVDSFEEARGRISNDPGEPVELTVRRDGQRRQVTLTTALVVPRELPSDSALVDAGLQPNDHIVAVEGEPATTPAALRQAARADDEVAVTVQRLESRESAADVTVTLTADQAQHLASVVRGLAGFFPASEGYSLVEALEATFVGEGSFPFLFARTIGGLGEIFGPEGIGAIPQQLSGGEREIGDATLLSPIGLTQIAGEGTAQSGLFALFGILAALNIFIGIFNLFPLPPLDGGHLAVLATEEAVNGVRRLRGRRPDFKVDPRAVAAIAVPVIALLGTLFLAVLVLDITNPLQLPQ